MTRVGAAGTRAATGAMVVLAAALAAGASLLHWAGIRTLAHELSAELVYAVGAATVLMVVAVTIGAEPWRVLRPERGLRQARGSFLVGLAVAAAAAGASVLGVLPSAGGGEHAGHAMTEVVGGDPRAWIRLLVELLLVAALGWLAIRSSRPA